jgi:hypothetical protein
MKRIINILQVVVLLLIPLSAGAQIGEHRSDLAIGVNGGYALSSIGFTPKVTQGMHGGMTGGLSVRYVCEKYFKTICSIYAELNYTSAGWKENIVDLNNQPVKGKSGADEQYSRTLSYVQLPIMAHLAWGKEHRGLQFFVQAGPQFGYMLSESTTANFEPADANLDDRANKEITQYGMKVENKFDYGIAAGAGLELSTSVGHFLLEGRYYYGLGNIYGSSKRDYFSKSNNGIILIKASYLIDI